MITEQDEQTIERIIKETNYLIREATPFLERRKQAAEKYLFTKEEHLLTVIEYHNEQLKKIFGL